MIGKRLDGGGVTYENPDVMGTGDFARRSRHGASGGDPRRLCGINNILYRPGTHERAH